MSTGIPIRPMSKKQFANNLGKIWYKGLSGENIKSGFEAVGIYPFNRAKYETSTFDPKLLQKYNKWIEMGKPEEMNEPEEPVTPTLEVDNEPVEYPDTAQFPKPKNRGGNSCEGSWVWIPKGQPKSTSSTPIASETQSPSSFLDIVAGRFSQTRASRPSRRGKRVPMTATHVTCQSSIPVVEYEEASTSAETSQQTSKRPQRGSKRKLIYTSSSNDDDDDEVTDEDDNIEIQEHISKIKIALNSENWREIIAEKLFAVHFDDPFKFYIGRLKNVFSEDENSNINKVVFKFLDFRGAGRWVAKPSADLETVPATSIFYGPIPHSLAVGNAIKLENDVQGRIRTLWNQFTRVFRKH